MKVRLTLTLDLRRVPDDDGQQQQQRPTTGERDSAIDGTLVDFGESSTRRRTEYPFGFTPHPEEGET